MKPAPHVRISAWAGAVLIAGGIVAFVVFFPVVAAVTFVLGIAFVAFAIGKEKGKMKGLLFFLKEILFGW